MNPSLTQSRSRWRGCAACALAVFTAVGALSSVAAAEPGVGVGVEGIAAFPAGGDVRGGFGANVVGGYSLELEPVVVVPEVAGSFHLLPGTATGIVGRGLAGARVGLAFSVEPSVYLRAGGGVLDVGGASTGGFALDAGFALDSRISRELSLGAHAGYGGLHGSTSLSWIALGGHVAFWFD